MPSPAQLDDGHLVPRAASGDAAAREELVRRYGRRLTGRIRVMNGAADWEDVAQEVWLQAFASLHMIRDGEAFWPWLDTVAKHTVYRTSARERRQRPTAAVEHALPTAESAEAPIIRADEHRRAWAAFDQLDGRNRDIIQLRIVEDLASDEVAKEMGWTIKAVYTGTQRGRAALAAAHKRVRLLLPPGLVGAFRRRHGYLEVSPEAAAAVVVASLVMVAAPGLLTPTTPATTPDLLTPAESVVMGSRDTPSASQGQTSTSEPDSAGDVQGRPATDDVEPGQFASVDGHTNVVRVPLVRQRVSTYDGDYEEYTEPDVHIGNDDLVAVRLWPGEHLPGEEPVDAPPIVVDPTGGTSPES